MRETVYNFGEGRNHSSKHVTKVNEYINKLLIIKLKKNNMRKIVFLVSVLVALATTLPAQVTREQADIIVREYLQSEKIEYELLYIYVNALSEEGITITTSNEETFTAKYACWAYYLDEKEPVKRRYLFVKGGDGNLLEVIANNDITPRDLNQWVPVETTGLVERDGNNIKLLYPNPTTGKLTIDNEQSKIENVEIFDVMGKMQKATTNKQNGEITIDISHFPVGVYLVKIKTEVGITTQKIIKY
ncbi:MAG: T9SS type A sorting domain-containing protein [Bacteroidales bacterium]|jgi:hypothetical protein|nr:T9SS type A sorting domain-containing protein [Bacteroidales bacterium]